MEFPPVTVAAWRAQVEKELGGRSFESALVHEAMERILIAPLYTEAPAAARASGDPSAPPFRICMRQARGATAADLVADVEGCADALWLGLGDACGAALAPADFAQTFFVFDTEDVASMEAVERHVSALTPVAASRFALCMDPLASRARGAAPFATLAEELAALGRVAHFVEARAPGASAVLVSTLPYHDAGADAADEIAFALSTGARYLDVLLESGLSPEQAARQIAVQIAVGRDTFVELCKLRALRTCFRKLLAAVGAPSGPRTKVHAVCSSRTLTTRDPWVNMLRVTTQMFSAILGGADLVTPNAFDQAFGVPSALARRVARNTGLVLREESFLGKVADPAGGSYYFETLTDALAREAWQRFRALEREGGMTDALESGRLAARIEAVARNWRERIAKRKVPILGVSEFAHLDETQTRPVPSEEAPPRAAHALAAERDAAAFEALRARAEAAETPPEAVLVTLGSFAESRPRAGFAAGFFAAGGIRTRESTTDEPAPLVCLCGTDERYTTEAAERARALKAAGCKRVLVAGRPSRLDTSLREAGVDGFIFLGCDAVTVLSELLGVLS
ncbi:methylmalonyl-CoA mutase family protein [Polyangium fumosum]|nr:methylmalonyl-CoA mutase family protein [Polyangium fumosum]